MVYIRTEEYKPILYRERKGCFAIPMVHSAVLINLRHKDSEVLTFLSSNIPDYDGPEDDIITFALAAKHYGRYFNFTPLTCLHFYIVLVAVKSILSI
jgi:collagen beta-1,O-galactosyltransferase